MDIPSTITIRRLQAPSMIEAAIRRRLLQLGRYYPRITRAHVLVEPAGRLHRDGNRYHIRIELTVPGGQIAIAHEPSTRPEARAMGVARTRKQEETAPAHKLVNVAIRDAFSAARRRLQDYARLQRGAVKQHPRSRRRPASYAPVA